MFRQMQARPGRVHSLIMRVLIQVVLTVLLATQPGRAPEATLLSVETATAPTETATNVTVVPSECQFLRV